MSGIPKVAVAVAVAVNVQAADDPSIQGATREGIQKAMRNYIQAAQVDGKYLIYDAVANQLLRLDYDYLHEGIVKKGGLYVSCADFKDSSGTAHDLDLLVARKGDAFEVVDVIVHKVGDTKRPYSLDTSADEAETSSAGSANRPGSGSTNK